MDNKKQYKVAFQGLIGSYSQQAVENFAQKYNLDFEAISKKNFRDLFDAINYETELGIVPIENSTAGSVTQCYDLFLEYDFEIIGELKLKIQHLLLANKGTNLEDIKEVYSHPQALMQCSNFLENSDITPISYLDTAGSANFVKQFKRDDIASIASQVAATHYDLEIIKKNFQNNLDNVTRFLLVKKKGTKFNFENKLEQPDKSSIIFETRDIPAALYKCLGGFSTNGINITKIESRPLGKKKFEYLFYIDFDGTKQEKNVKLALEELEFFSEKVIFLGSYKKD